LLCYFIFIFYFNITLYFHISYASASIILFSEAQRYGNRRAQPVSTLVFSPERRRLAKNKWKRKQSALALRYLYLFLAQNTSSYLYFLSPLPTQYKQWREIRVWTCFVSLLCKYLFYISSYFIIVIFLNYLHKSILQSEAN